MGGIGTIGGFPNKILYSISSITTFGTHSGDLILLHIHTLTNASEATQYRDTLFPICLDCDKVAHQILSMF